MDFTSKKKKQSSTKYTLSIKFSQKVFNEFKKEATKKLAKTLDTKGFRKGKVPANVAQRQLGDEKITQEALRLAIPEVYARAVKEQKLQPIGPPKVKVKKFEDSKPIELEAELEILGKITLPDLKKIKAKKDSPKLTDKEVKKGLKDLQKRFAQQKPKKGAVAKGDWVEVEFEGSVKGAKVDQLTSKNHPFVVGEGGFIKGFEEKIIGMKKGEENEFDLTIPKKVPDKLIAGKKAHFKVKVNQIKKVILLPLKELAKKLGAKDEKDFEDRFKKAQEQQKKQGVEKKFEQEVITKVVEATKLTLPQVLIEQETQRLAEMQKNELAQQQMTLEEYFKKFNIDQKEFEKSLQQTAKQNVKVALVMAEISKKAKVEPTDKEIKLKSEQLISEGMMQGGDKNQLREQYSSEQGKGFIQNVVRNEKTLDYLKKQIK